VTNAIYFKGKWATSSTRKKRTKDEAFQTGADKSGESTDGPDDAPGGDYRLRRRRRPHDAGTPYKGAIWRWWCSCPGCRSIGKLEEKNERREREPSGWRGWANAKENVAMPRFKEPASSALGDTLIAMV